MKALLEFVILYLLINEIMVITTTLGIIFVLDKDKRTKENIKKILYILYS